MKKSTRIFALLCTFIMSLTMLSGCAGKAASTPTAVSGSTAAAVDEKDMPTLIWWNIGKQPDDLEESMVEINKYIAEKIGVKVDFRMANWGDWDTKMNTILNSGEAFDIMFTNNTKYVNQVATGAFADITELVQSASPELFSFIPADVWDGTKIGGRIYSVPTYKDSSITQYWMFDDQYVQKYKIDTAAIKTLTDLDKPFRAMKEGEGETFYPLQLAQGSPFNGFFYQYYDGLAAGLEPLGVSLNGKDHKVVCTLEQEDIQNNLKQLHTWYQDGIINPDAPTLIEQAKKLPFNTAQGYPGAEAQWQILQGVDKYDTFQVFGPMYMTETIQGSLNAISANSKYKEESLKLLQLVNTDPKLRDMFAFGLEGKHFEYTGDKVVKKLTDTWTIPMYSVATFFTMSTLNDAPADQWEQVRQLNEKAEKSVCLGFALDVTNLQTEIANCKSTWDKYRFEMLTGASDPAVAIPACVKELKSSGLDTIMQEAQKQLDAYYA
ncbi:MAG: ABC transporter substrate-binding protein [Ruthenibacterium sp.]